MLEALLVSTGVVAVAEIGDKTQLLALVLAARYRKPVPIILGILVATLANHALAAAVGAWLVRALGPDTMRWAVGVSFPRHGGVGAGAGQAGRGHARLSLLPALAWQRKLRTTTTLA